MLNLNFKFNNYIIINLFDIINKIEKYQNQNWENNYLDKDINHNSNHVNKKINYILENFSLFYYKWVKSKMKNIKRKI